MREYKFTEDNAVIFDLEITSWPGSLERQWSLPDEYPEIIQIGAVKIETAGDMREVECFSNFVRPLKNPILSDYIVNLTGITQEKIETEGVLFPLALSQFLNFIGDYPVNILANGDDKEVIEENCQIHSIAFPPIFKKTVNLKPYFTGILGVSKKDCTSATLPELFGLNNNEIRHDALGDAKSISQVLRYLHIKKQN